MSRLGFVLLLPSLLSFAAAQNASTLYTPVRGDCPPNFQLVRSAGDSSTLSDQETAYVKARKSDVLPGAWKTYVSNVNAATSNALPDYVTNALTGSDPPTLGIAVSGGGYRAALFGAGVANGLDGRNQTAASKGTGGLLQAATYLAGLSGGSWFVTSLAQADFPTIPSLVVGNGTQSWLTTLDLLQPGTGVQQTLFASQLFSEIAGKYAAGFPVTFVDAWSRGLSRHFVTGTTPDTYFNGTANGAGVTFSSIANTPSFSSHNQPFPIVVANMFSEKSNKSNSFGPAYPNSLSDPSFEFNVYETGSFDPTLLSFTPTQYLGTRNTSSCVTNFDQAAFVMGTSSDLFAEFNTSAAAFQSSTVGPAVSLLNRTYPEKDVSLAVAYYPNPFFGVNSGKFISSDQESLTLNDGGDGGEVVPFQPLIVKSRKVDVIIAVDASNNSMGFANGLSLSATQKRTKLFPGSYNFPPVPQSNTTFINQKLALQPTFFGCDSSQDTPLVVYIANGGPPRDGSKPATNTSTFQLQYNTSDVQTFLDQAFVTTTQGALGTGGGNQDPQWPACLACAVADRARARAGADRGGVCAGCFSRYCWNGTESTGSTNSGGGGKKNGAEGVRPFVQLLLGLSVAVLYLVV